MKILLALLFLCIGFSQEISEKLESFDEIEIGLSANTIVKFGDEFHIEIDGREKDLKNIEYEVRNNVLIVETKRGNRFFNFNFGNDSKIKIRITTKKLVRVDVSGGGSLKLPKFDQEELIIGASGSTDISLSGEIETLRIDKSGSGDIHVSRLKSEMFRFDASGSGDLEVKGTSKNVRIDKSGSCDVAWSGIEADKITINSTGSGELYFKGSSDILDVEISGSGDFKGYRFETRKLIAELHGSCDMEITVLEELDASVSGSSDLVYAGKPDVVRKDESGSGDIERR